MPSADATERQFKDGYMYFNIKIMEHTPEEFEVHLRKSGYSRKTVFTYSFIIRKIGEKLDYHTCKYSDILKEISRPDISLHYRQTIVAALKKYFQYLVDKGLRSDHPCARLIHTHLHFANTTIQSLNFS